MHTYLSGLNLLNFKNYDELSIRFCSKINCITGNNGTGKTNILDAIYYLSLCKSCFTNVDTQNIRHNEDFFTLQGEYQKGEKIDNIYCGVKSGHKKILKRNGKEYERLSDHIGLLPLVMISPADSMLITEGSEERRKFIDSVLSQFDPTYLNDLLRYNRALLQRNQLLKDFDLKNWYDPDMVDMWDEQLIETGIRIHETRKIFFNEINDVFQRYYNFISEGKEDVSLTYESQLLESDFKDILKESLDKDRKVLYTTVGIHKDDIEFSLGSHSIKRIGSQGQQKTFLVSLKLAQFEYIKNKSSQYPILLMDDIFDKFDSQRVNKIVKLASRDDFGQIFITDTNYHRMEEVLNEIGGEFMLFDIDNREVTLKLHNTR
jgi:DNA replication and repair protein RecF